MLNGVLNLIITGLPSILRELSELMERVSKSVLNLIITGLPSILCRGILVTLVSSNEF